MRETVFLLTLVSEDICDEEEKRHGVKQDAVFAVKDQKDPDVEQVKGVRAKLNDVPEEVVLTHGDKSWIFRLIEAPLEDKHRVRVIRYQRIHIRKVLSSEVRIVIHPRQRQKHSER